MEEQQPKAPTMKESGKIHLVYILSASHSGSTMLAMLLGAHPEVCTVGELKATSLGDSDRYLCSCRKRIRECPFWTGISRDMAIRGFSFDITNAGTDFKTVANPYVRKLLSPLHRGPALEKIRDLALNLSPTWRTRLPQIQAVNAALMECVLEHTGGKIIVDSSKVGIRLKYLLRNPSLDVKIIRLIRDGRGVALTYMNQALFADASDPSLRSGGTGIERANGLSMAEAAQEWRRSNEEADVILHDLERSRWIDARYEHLCLHTAGTLNNLFSFIGVDPAKAITDFRSVAHHVVGNGMRLDSTGEISLDERWKTILPTSDLQIFDSVAGRMNRRLGYK